MICTVVATTFASVTPYINCVAAGVTRTGGPMFMKGCCFGSGGVMNLRIEGI